MQNVHSSSAATTSFTRGEIGTTDTNKENEGSVNGTTIDTSGKRVIDSSDKVDNRIEEETFVEEDEEVIDRGGVAPEYINEMIRKQNNSDNNSGSPKPNKNFTNSSNKNRVMDNQYQDSVLRNEGSNSNSPSRRRITRTGINNASRTAQRRRKSDWLTIVFRVVIGTILVWILLFTDIGRISIRSVYSTANSISRQLTTVLPPKADER